MDNSLPNGDEVWWVNDSGPWSAGGFYWTILAEWKVEGGPTNSFGEGWIESFEVMDTAGTMSVSKFGHTVTRTTNDVYTTVR